MAFTIVLLIAAIYVVGMLNVRTIMRVGMITTANEGSTILLLSLLFLPGTLVHELAHLICAEFLLVPTSDLHLFPEILPDRTVKLGSVRITQTDWLRRLIIGIAPILIGLLLLWTGQYFILNFLQYTTVAHFLYYFLLFQVSHTMFSSRKDLEGAVWGILGLGVILFVLKFASDIVSISYLTTGIHTINTYIITHAVVLQKGLWDALIIDASLFIGLKLLQWALSRVLHRA